MSRSGARKRVLRRSSSDPSQWSRTAAGSSSIRKLDSLTYDDMLPLVASIPTIDATSDTQEQSCDWPEAFYEATAEPESGDWSWSITHRLSGAPGIQALLDSREAHWAVEARCAETMYLDMQTRVEPRTTITVPASEFIGGKLYLWPGVIAVEDCELDPSGTAWGTEPIQVGKGCWLARGEPKPIELKESSPLAFRADDTLESEGAVTISPESSGQDTRFVIRARKDRIRRLSHHKPALTACWATALAMLPYQGEYEISEDELGTPRVDGSQLGDMLARRLRERDPGIPLWDSKEAWDPMRAASLLIPLTPEDHNEEEE